LSGPQCAEAQERQARFLIGSGGMKIVAGDNSPESHYVTTFRGKVSLTGRLVIEFERSCEDGIRRSNFKDEVRVVYFEPDARSLMKLPRAVGDYYPKEPYYFGTDLDVFKTLLKLTGLSRAQRIMESCDPRFEYRTQIVIGQLLTSVQCDHRVFDAAVISFKALRRTEIASAESKWLGC
jgi:hypothetical protein